MNPVTRDDIVNKFYACYDPAEIGMPKDYKATPVEFIDEYRYKVKELIDIPWVLLREDYLSEKECWLYVIWCARQVQHLMKDERSIKALNVAEAYINGKATDEDLKVARQGAKDAYDDAAYFAAYYAVRAAARAAYNGAGYNGAAYAIYYANGRNEEIKDEFINKLIDKLRDVFVEKGGCQPTVDS